MAFNCFFSMSSSCSVLACLLNNSKGMKGRDQRVLLGCEVSPVCTELSLVASLQGSPMSLATRPVNSNLWWHSSRPSQVCKVGNPLCQGDTIRARVCSGICNCITSVMNVVKLKRLNHYYSVSSQPQFLHRPLSCTGA